VLLYFGMTWLLRSKQDVGYLGRTGFPGVQKHDHACINTKCK